MEQVGSWRAGVLEEGSHVSSLERGYNELWLVDVIFNHGQVLCHQLGMDFLLSENDLDPRLQVKNT